VQGLDHADALGPIAIGNWLRCIAGCWWRTGDAETAAPAPGARPQEAAGVTVRAVRQVRVRDLAGRHSTCTTGRGRGWRHCCKSTTAVSPFVQRTRRRGRGIGVLGHACTPIASFERLRFILFDEFGGCKLSRARNIDPDTVPKCTLQDQISTVASAFR
jgi:hypothetical protein